MSFFVNLLKATRPHTYPLSVVGVLVGNAVAWSQLKPHTSHPDGHFWAVLGLTLLTAIALQILSNLANDYGDGLLGTDTHRSDRQFGSTLSPKALMNAIIGCVLFIVVSGISLLVISLGIGQTFWAFLGLGLCAIVAAITYTMGKNPYGYQAKGEIAVFLFFGVVNVLGSGYLQSQTLDISSLVFAAVIGILCTCVLVVNNLRDIDSDKISGKHTLAAVLGKHRMSAYYIKALMLAFGLLGGYAIFAQNYYFVALILLTCPLRRHIHAVGQYNADIITSQNFGQELKQIVKITLITGLIISLSLGAS